MNANGLSEGQRLIGELIRASLIVGTLKCDEVHSDPRRVEAIGTMMEAHLDSLVDRLTEMVEGEDPAREGGAR